MKTTASEAFVRAVEADVVKLGGIRAYVACVKRYREALAANKAIRE